MEEYKETYDRGQCVSGIYPNCLVCSCMCEERAKDFAERRKKEQKPENRFVKFYKEDVIKWCNDKLKRNEMNYDEFMRRMNLLDIVHQYVLNACDSVWILHSKWHEVQRAVFPWVSIYL